MELYAIIEDGIPAPKLLPPPPLSSEYERPDKNDAIKEHTSRFNLK